MRINPEAFGSSKNTWQHRQITGAALLGGLAIASAFYADGRWGKRHWPSNENEFVGLNDAVDDAALSLGGLGIADASNLAEDAVQFLPGDVAYARYSNDGFSIKELATIFGKQARSIKTLHLHGHSMGGPIGLEMQREAMVPDLRLGKIVLNCSPFDANDARLGRHAKLLDLVKWPVGPSNKFAFSLLRSFVESQPLGHAWERAKEDALGGSSPRLWLSQMNIMRQVNLSAYLKKYYSLVGPETAVIYCRPEQPLDDTVVDTLQASQKYADFFSELGVPYKDMPIPNVRHAESAPTFAYLANLR